LFDIRNSASASIFCVPPGKRAVDFDEDQNTLEIFVENMGRINYGRYLKDYKGITESVLIEYQFQFGWEVYCLEMDNIEKVQFEQLKLDKKEGPLFLKGSFEAKEIGDTYLRLDNLTRGAVWINGFNIGRYWTPAGPQKTLYVPAPLIRKGINDVIIFETDKMEAPEIEFAGQPDLG
jgi:beta-galactosidase